VGSGRQEGRLGPSRAGRSAGAPARGQPRNVERRLRDSAGENDRLRVAKAALEESRADLADRYDALEEAHANLADRYDALEASHANLADRYDFAPAAFFTVDDRCRILEANLTAATMLGRPRGKLVGAFLTGLVLPGQRPEMRWHVQRCLADRARVSTELTFSVPGGAPLYAHVTSTPLVDAAGAALRSRTMIVDISALKASQDGLRFLTAASGCLVSSFDTTASLVEVARLAVPAVADACLVDLVRDGGTLERVECVLDDHASQAASAQLRTSAAPRADEGSALQRVLRTRKPLLLEASAVDPVGRAEWAGQRDQLIRRLQPKSILYVPIVARGDLFGVLTFVSGRSGRRYVGADLAALGDLGTRAAMAIENARLYAEAQRAIAARQDVLSFVSHDLKNPLMGIMLSVETMLRAAPVTDRRRSAGQLQRIQRAAHQMRHMIEDLLDVTMLEGGRLKVEIAAHDLGRLLEEVAELFAARASAAGIRFELSGQRAITVDCDRSRLQRVVSNLVDNALKFTPRGGRITLSAGVADGRALCAVVDTGKGIPPSIRPHVFERFVQAAGTGRQGRGLGLYIAKGLIEAQGGAIWVDSQSGVGTSFSFTVPLASAASVGRSRPDVRATPDVPATAEPPETTP